MIPKRFKAYLPHKGVEWEAFTRNKDKFMAFVPYQIIGGKWWSLAIIRANYKSEKWDK